MKDHLLIFLTLICPLIANAGSQSRDCETSDKRIVMGAGNSTNRIQIQYSLDGQNKVYDVPVKIMPDFDYNTEETDETVSAIPISKEKIISTDHQVMHVIHQDGTECYGREAWDDRSVQSYILTGKDGEPLTWGSPERNVLQSVEGATDDGYIIAEFQCHSYGITTAGGCYVEEGDEVIWEKD